MRLALLCAGCSSLQMHMVQWYPGHIARAERQLKEQLKMVDVVLEVRDGRIPQSTTHPQVWPHETRAGGLLGAPACLPQARQQ